MIDNLIFRAQTVFRYCNRVLHRRPIIRRPGPGRVDMLGASRPKLIALLIQAVRLHRTTGDPRHRTIARGLRWVLENGYSSQEEKR